MKFTMYKKETTDKMYHENPYRAVNFAKDADLLRNRKVNTKYQRLTMEQYISLCRHPVSEVRDIARQELKRIWMMDPKKLKAVIAGFEECAYGENIFSLILQLPSDVTSVYKQDLQRLGMETNDKMLVEWIRRLRHLDWVSASERKEMLKKCLASESDRVRDGAMACWLK